MFKMNASLAQTTKTISRTRFTGQFHVYIQLGTETPNVYENEVQTGKSSCYLRDGRGWGLSTALLKHSIRVSSCATNLTVTWPGTTPCAGQVHGHLSCSVSIHSSERIWEKLYLIDSLCSIIQRVIKTKVFPTPVWQSSRLWSRVHYTDQHELFLWTKTVIKCPP